MAEKILSPKYFMRRQEHLFRAADRLVEEAETLNLAKDENMSKYVALRFRADIMYNEASTIDLMLRTIEHYGNDEAKNIIKKERERREANGSVR